MERLKHIKESLMTCVEGQLDHLSDVDTKELGEAIDMIKDLEEAIYYCTIVKAMEEQEHDGRKYFGGDEYCYPYYRDMDMDMGRMYYTERQPRNSKGEFMSPRGNRGRERYYGGPSKDEDPYYYKERELPLDLHDRREGRSALSRRSYIESKELHRGKEEKIKELEKYMKELGEDIVEMIEDASPEEKQMLERKMTQLTSKIAQLNV